MDVHRVALPETVRTADALIGSLEAEIERSEYLVVAVLVVQTELGYLQLGYQHSELAAPES